MSYFANKNKVSTVNSSTSPLNAAAVFTGTWEDVSAYSSLTIAVKTDQNGTFQIQFSSDGTNIDSTLTRYYRTDQIEPPHKFSITRKYVRVVFTNTSASNQTYLRLQTITGNQSDLNIPIDAIVSQDYDAKVTRPTDYRYEVALGRRQGATTWNKFGYNADLDIGTELVAARGGTFTILTSASTLTLASSSTDDDGSPAGIGARTVTIVGIDANRVAQTETVTMNGTTNVVTSLSWLGVNMAYVSLSGSSQSNVGNITITATTGGSSQGLIPATESSVQQAVLFTQLNHQFLADFLVLNAEKTGGGASPKIRFKGWVYNSVTNTKSLILNQFMDTTSENSLSINPTQPFVIPESCVLWFEATTDTDNSFVSCRFSGIEVKDIDA